MNLEKWQRGWRGDIALSVILLITIAVIFSLGGLLEFLLTGSIGDK